LNNRCRHDEHSRHDDATKDESLANDDFLLAVGKPAQCRSETGAKEYLEQAGVGLLFNKTSRLLSLAGYALRIVRLNSLSGRMVQQVPGSPRLPGLDCWCLRRSCSAASRGAALATA